MSSLPLVLTKEERSLALGHRKSVYSQDEITIFRVIDSPNSGSDRYVYFGFFAIRLFITSDFSEIIEIIRNRLIESIEYLKTYNKFSPVMMRGFRDTVKDLSKVNNETLIKYRARIIGPEETKYVTEFKTNDIEFKIVNEEERTVESVLESSLNVLNKIEEIKYENPELFL